MSANAWKLPAEYCEDDDAVERCIEALLAVEKQFGTSAFIDAVKEATEDPDYLARKRGARPLTEAWVRERILSGDTEKYAIDTSEPPVAIPFPGTGDDTEHLAQVVGFPLRDPHDELTVENGGGDAPSA